MADLITVENVELCTVGTFNLIRNTPKDGLKETSFTIEDLESIIASQDDPHIKAPRIKLGHQTDPDGDWLPAFGVITNLRLDDDLGQTLIGDLEGVPEWLAEVMPTAWPNRSLEARLNVNTQSSEYSMLMDNIALLGIEMPGVTSLDDLESWFEATQPKGVVLAKKNDDIEAAVEVEDIRRAYYAQKLTGDYSWIRTILIDPLQAIIVDDDNGGLWQREFTIGTDEAIEFGDAMAVKTEYVAASAAIYTDKKASMKGVGESMEIRKELGLADDSSDEDVNKELDDKIAALTAARDERKDDPENDELSQTGSDTEEKKPAEEKIAAKAAPDGTVIVDKSVIEELRAGAKAGTEARAAQVANEQEAIITSAIKAGKFAPARREHYGKLLAADPEGTESLIDGLEPGIVPVGEEQGSTGTKDGSEARYPDWFMPRAAANRRRRETALAAQKGDQ